MSREFVRNYTLCANTRESIRRELVNLFLQEEAGFDMANNQIMPTKYKYIVENINQYSIYLQRPTRLNKGFDFVVNVENMYFKLNGGKRHRNPSHNDIVIILKHYQTAHSNEYGILSNLIRNIYQCQQFNILQQSQNMPPFINYDGEQIPIAVVLYCIK